jgi:hypothetical protein
MWSGYILLIDAIVYRLGGSSWLTSKRKEFPFLLLISVAVWLLFEAYNLHIKNWGYFGLPENTWLRNFGYFWSFATIMPGVFETWDLLQVIFRTRPVDRNPPSNGDPPDRAAVLLGLFLVTIPLALPERMAAYLFGAVWVGFIFLMDPLNQRLGAPTLRFLWQSRQWKPLILLLSAGLLCGFLWETWNYQAVLAQGAHWVYFIPEPLRIFGWHFGKMPVLGLLGFPPFALELYAFYVFIREILGGDRLFGRS